MNAEDILALMATHPDHYCVENGYVRTKGCNDCPIEHEAYLKTGIRKSWKHAAKDLGLSLEDQELIICAADDPDSRVQGFRERMLEALGLNPSEAGG